ncbi:hypothetical protein [Clostridium beijerinckii]|uniref:hypothetical protein n=1 Tax=Clostridium beijerinckii TaxID=1520 RepID=UPI00047EA981|nr:hypothetical protein [Clostridium beijerinckii]
MKRKKQGSTLIVVIIIFTFVTIVMTATLSMAASGYKARVIESKRVESLYSAESGLDIAYNIVGRTFNSAVAYANDQVTRLTEGNGDNSDPNTEKYSKLQEDIEYWKNRQKTDEETIDEFKRKNREKIMRDNEYIELLKNEEFKRSFNLFLYIQNNNIIDNENNTDELAKTIVGKKYVKNIDAELENDRYKHVTFNTNDGQDPELLVYDYQHPITSVAANEDKSGIIYSSGDENISKGAHDIPLQGDYKLTIKVFDKQEYIVKVTSNFGGSNLRQVQATYTIKVPDYMQSIKRYQVLVDKPLIVNKCMNLENSDNLNINGDIFVQGEKDDSAGTGEITYDKYLGRIKINESSNVTFNGDVITRGTLNVEDNTGVNITGNVYAGNIYLGKVAKGDLGFAQGSWLHINSADKGKVYLDNDLTLKAKDSEINMNDFYGINDKNINYDDKNLDSSKRNIINNGKSGTQDYPSDVSKSSSSIIVNGYKGGSSDSSIVINNSAYIMGTAHIATDDNYQTGESGAVKGNYIAYSVPNPTNTSEKFKYDSPLYVLDEDDEDNVFNKAKHFKDYWANPRKADPGGIQWPINPSTGQPNVFSVGALVYKSGDDVFVKEPNYSMGLEAVNGDVWKMRNKFAGKVYKFGEEVSETSVENYYANGEENAASVSELIDLSNIMDANYKMKDQEKKTEKAIFNKDSRKIIIKKSTGEDSIDIPSDSSMPITIEAKDGIINAVIATNGDVTIEEDITFNGSIVTNGSLGIEGDGVTINKNNEIVNSVQAQNPDLFQSVFKDGKYYNEAVDYDLSNYLDKKLWKLIK